MADKTAAELEDERAAARGDHHEATDDPPGGDAAGDDDAAGAGDDGKKKEGEDEPAPVPYARFREVNETARTDRDARIRAEAERDALKAAAAPKKDAPPAIDITALRKAKVAALNEGDIDKAAELEEQIDAERDRRNVATAKEQAKDELRHEQNDRELARAAEKVIDDHPFLDSNSPEKIQGAIDEVLEWRGFYEMRGMTPADALNKAVKRVAPAYAKKEGEQADDLAKRREALAISRGADTARKQPPVPGAGKGGRSSGDSPITDVSKLSDAEYAKLPVEEKRRLRGDAGA